MALAVMAVVVSGSVGFAARPAFASNTVVQWNIDGAFRSTGASRTAQADVMINYLNFFPALFGGANEICTSQVTRIAALSGEEAYYLTTFIGGAARPDCGTSSSTIYNNAVFYRETLSFVDVDAWRFSTSPDSSPGRGLLCVKIAYIFSVSVGCSTHLSPYGAYPSSNSTQINETIFITNAYAGTSSRVYMMGDFNARAGRSAFDVYYSQYWETDPRSSKRWTLTSAYGCGSSNSNGRGVDFVFGNKAGNPSTGTGLIAGETGAKSDHCLTLRVFG